VEEADDRIIIDGRTIAIVSHLNPLDIPWRTLGVELVPGELYQRVRVQRTAPGMGAGGASAQQSLALETCHPKATRWVAH